MSKPQFPYPAGIRINGVIEIVNVVDIVNSYEKEIAYYQVASEPYVQTCEVSALIPYEAPLVEQTEGEPKLFWPSWWSEEDTVATKREIADILAKYDLVVSDGCLEQLANYVADQMESVY